MIKKPLRNVLTLITMILSGALETHASSQPSAPLPSQIVKNKGISPTAPQPAPASRLKQPPFSPQDRPRKAPQAPQPPSFTAVRLCNGSFGLLVNHLRGMPIPNKLPGTEKLCVPAPIVPLSNRYTSLELQKAIDIRILTLRTRIQAALKELQKYPETIFDLVAHAIDSQSNQNRTFDFYEALNRVDINTKELDFYLQLCRGSYVKSENPKNPTPPPYGYILYLNKLQERLQAIKNRLETIDKDLKTIRKEGSQREHLLQTKIQLVQDQAAAQLAIQFFQDPNLKVFWDRMDNISGKDTRKFVPLFTLYRNQEQNPSTPAFLLKKFVEIFKKPQETKEISGILLFKEGTPGTNGEAPIDEMIVAFKGSNTLKDWEHNFDYFQYPGLGTYDLFPNLQMHRGMLSALEESLKDAGIKINLWLRNYKLSRQKSDIKPILKITLVGHSLGGALANLMGIFVKQNISTVLQDVAIVDVRVVTFATPPLFTQSSAKLAESILGKAKILRFWTFDDPVANLFGSREIVKKGMQSFIASLIGYFHIGTSMPLFDQDHFSNPKTFDQLLAPHFLGHYFAVLDTGWQTTGNKKLAYIRDLMKARNVFQAQEQLQQLEQLKNFMENSFDWSNKIMNFSLQDIKEVIQKPVMSFLEIPHTVKHFPSLEEQNFEKGNLNPLKFKRVDLSTESKSISYHQRSLNQDLSITLDRSTSCKIDNLAKQFKFNPTTINPSDVTCVCCIVKNTFVSFGGGTIFHQAKDILQKKSIKTPLSIMNYCEKEQHCANPTTKQNLFPPFQDLMLSFGEIMESVGLTQTWLSKKID